MPELQRFDASTPVDWDDVWAAFDADGGLIIENFIGADLLDRLNREVRPLVDRHRSGSTTEGFWTEFHGTETKRVTGLAAVSPACSVVECRAACLRALAA